MCGGVTQNMGASARVTVLDAIRNSFKLCCTLLWLWMDYCEWCIVLSHHDYKNRVCVSSYILLDWKYFPPLSLPLLKNN